MFASATAAWGRGPPTMIHTKDGSVYYGELVERVTDDHVTILNAAGEIKRFAMKDIDPSPAPDAPLYRPPEPQAPPTGTVRVKGGTVFYGEILERVPNDHVTIRLASGETKVIGWDDIDESVPPPAPSPPRPPGPTETVRTRNGDVYHGDLIEKVVGNHVTLALATGHIVTIAWSDIAERRNRERPKRPKPDTILAFHANVPSAVLEHKLDVGWEAVCRGACEDVASPTGMYRVTATGEPSTDSFRLSTTHDNRVDARIGSSGLHALGTVFVALGVPASIAGTCLIFADAGTDPFGSGKSALDAANVIVNVLAVALVTSGIGLVTSTSSSVRVNGETVARALLDGVHF